METVTFTQSNYENNYNAFQLSLPLDLSTNFKLDDEVVSFQKALEGVNLYKYLKRKERRGRKGYDNVMLLKVVLFGMMIGINTLEGYEKACRYDVRFMYITNEEKPSFMAFERLFKDYLINDIDKIFFDISQSIGNLMNIDKDIQYIDGTKIEANANKYSFVYKTRILHAREKLFLKTTDAIKSINLERGFHILTHDFYCAQEIGYIAQYLMETMVKENVEIVYGRGNKKTQIQRWYDLFLEYYLKLDEYEYWLSVIGENRNSCSKTDNDATMCATKMDYYCNTGLSRPCYNAQIAVSNGVIVNADLFQRPGDTKTFKPFMDRYYQYTGTYPTYPMADAGYGSYDNYMYCLTHGMKLCMKYTMYAKKNQPKFKKQIYNPLNWETDEFGYKICPNNHVFNKYVGDYYDEKGDYLRIIQKYTSEESCEGCPFQKECTKKEIKRRVLSRDVVLNEFYQTVDSLLSSDQGKELKKQRSIQVEGAFGVLKQDIGFVRFSKRGLENTRMEFLITCIGYNLKKYHKYRLKNTKKEILN